EGMLDRSFNATGYVVTDMGGDYEYIRSVVIQPDGKVLAGGYTGAGGYAFALARYNTAGTLDTSLGSGGKVVTSIVSGMSSQAEARVLQTDGRIIAAGNSGCDFALARFNAYGRPDTS